MKTKHVTGIPAKLTKIAKFVILKAFLDTHKSYKEQKRLGKLRKSKAPWKKILEYQRKKLS